MSNTVDQLLLTPTQLSQVQQLQRAWQNYQKKGDTAGMEWAHQQAEQIRARAGYSGGNDGSDYHLLPTTANGEGYRAYESLVNDYADRGMKAIAAGYQSALANLDQQRQDLTAQGEQNQSAARSAAWNRQRMAQSGHLTRGLENTGLADVVTATYLNQAAANAYQALLDSKQDLQENDAARIKAHADALTDAAELQQEMGELLGDGYRSFYEKDADRRQEQVMQQLKAQTERDQLEQDYYYKLALQQLKRQWELEDLANK